MNLEEIGLRIKKCRREKHLTQEQFSEIIGVSPHYVYEIERGTKAMSIYTFYAIVLNLNISADYLLFGEKHNLKKSTPIQTPSDNLDTITDNLSSVKRDALAEVISILLKHMK